MYNKFMMKLLNILPLVGANGSGPSTGSSGGVNLAGGLSNALAVIGDFLLGIATTVWGWLMTLIFNVLKLVLNIMDVLQFFIHKLVGIDIYNNPDWADVITLKESDLIVKLITSETVLKLFRTVLILSAVLLIIFCIISIVKSNFDSVMGGEDGKEPAANKVMKKAGKSIFFCFLVPFLLIVGILGSNVILASICNAINGNNNLTLGGVIFTTSSYDANKYRIYAKNDLRVPMYYADATMVINQSDYRNDEDMRALFYSMAKGNVYIPGITEATLEKKNNNEYDEWYGQITSMDKSDYTLGNVGDVLAVGAGIRTGAVAGGLIGGPAGGLAGATIGAGAVVGGLLIGDILESVFAEAGEDGAGMSEVASAFEEDFRSWYAEHFGSMPLNDLGMLSDVTWKISKYNWDRNDGIDTTSVDFSATYETSAENLYFNSDGSYVDIFDNTEAYSRFESFATLPVEYYVMADLIDYSIEMGAKFYYVNADNQYIKWSDIVVSRDPDDPTVNVDTYAGNYAVFRYYEDGKPRYQTHYGNLAESTRYVKNEDDDFYTDTAVPGLELELLSTDAFYVSYYDGTKRLYWSADGMSREQDGSTFIICTRDAQGYFIPVTQETTSFSSDFLAKDYDGPIVARGLFEKTSLIPQETPQPTAIREQLVDDSGNEVAVFDNGDAVSLRVVNYAEGKDLTSESLTNYIGTLEGLKGQVVNESGDVTSLLQGSLNYLSAAATPIGGGDGDWGNLYINSNIKYYNLTGGDSKTVTFYDKDGYPMPWGGAPEGEEPNEFAEITKMAVTQHNEIYLYYILNKEGLYQPIVSYADLDTATIADYWKEYAENITDVEEVSTLSRGIIVQYKADLIKFTPGEGCDPINMIVGARAVGIGQKGYNGDNFVSLGAFEVPALYNIIGANQENADGELIEEYLNGYLIDANSFGANGSAGVYKTHIDNLYVKNGVVYTGNGNVFLSINDLVESYYDYSIGYQNIEAQALANILYEMKNDPGKLGDLTGYYNVLLEDLGMTAEVSESAREVYEFITEGDGAGNLIEYKTIVYSMLYGQNFLIGLGAGVQPLDARYFGYEQKGEEVEVTLYTPLNTPIVSGSEPGQVTEVNTEAVGKSYGRFSADVEIPIKVVMKYGKDSIVDAVLVNTTSTGKYTSSYESYDYSLKMKLNYTKCGGFAFGGSISNVSLEAPEAVASRSLITLKNGALYCSSMRQYVLSIDAMKQLAINNVADLGSLICSQMFDMQTIAEYDNKYIYFERGQFGLSPIFDFAFHTKGNNILNGIAVRFALGLVKTYDVNVLYRLEGGGFMLNYNFNPGTGIAVGNLFDMRYINPIVFIFATAIIFGMLWNMVWNLITRIYEIGIRFIILPAVLSVDVLSDGKFKAWKDAVVDKVMAAYSVLIMLNLYFALIPSVKDLTADLISWEDLPSTFTGLFANIGLARGGGFIASIGGNISGGIATFISKLVAAWEITETSIITITGWLNKIIFMMFLLVLTTLVKQGPKILGKFTGSDDDISDGSTWKKVKDLRDDYDKSLVGKGLNKIGEIGTNLAVKGVTGAFKGAKNLLGDKAKGLASSFNINASRSTSTTITGATLAGSGIGSLSGSGYSSSARGSRYGGGRVITPDTGIGDDYEDDATEKKSGSGGAMGMAYSDPAGDDSGGGTTVVQTVYMSGGGGSSSDDDNTYEEEIEIDDSLTYEEMYNKTAELLDSCQAKREEAAGIRQMAEADKQELDATLVSLQTSMAEWKQELEQAQLQRGAAYDMKREDRANGVSSEASNRAWEEASEKVREAQAQIKIIKEQIEVVEQRQLEDEELLEEAKRLEKDADLDDMQATLYFEAAQDKEYAEATALRDDLNALKGDFEALVDETTRIESQMVDNINDTAKLRTEFKGRADEVDRWFGVVDSNTDSIISDAKNLREQTADLEDVTLRELDKLERETFGAIDTKADAKLTQQAIDTKADADETAKSIKENKKSLFSINIGKPDRKDD